MTSPLAAPLTLPCGARLKNRIAKSAMSDSLGDGRGQPTEAQIRIYDRWARGGLALAVVGEVQGTGHYAEKPGNLVLDADADTARFDALARAGSAEAAHLWLQLGHAGAMADPLISAPKGPSALDLPGLRCAALSVPEIEALPAEFARTAARAKRHGFGGVQVHAAHGFLLSQFLSPLFNHRTDAYGGTLENRMRLMRAVIDAVRAAVGPAFPIGLKINASDQLEGGFQPDEALAALAALDTTGLDLIDISGGTYFPGAPSASDRAGAGPYFLDFADRARAVTSVPLMVTGGFKTRAQAEAAVATGRADVVGLARALVIDPDLPSKWLDGQGDTPPFPRFEAPPEGGVTAWYTMQITRIATGAEPLLPEELTAAITAYEARDAERRTRWTAHFS